MSSDEKKAFVMLSIGAIGLALLDLVKNLCQLIVELC